MAVYWTLHCDITDPDTFATVCPALSGPVVSGIRRHGGEVVAVGRAVLALDGPSHAVDLLFRFEAEAGVDGFLNDPDYAEARALWRRFTANTHSVVIPIADPSAFSPGGT